jgi:threonine dehydrogenase-like Zn-dependent dehydrogenase
VLALTVSPGVADSARLETLAEPPGDPQGLVLACLSVGICGTDAEILSGKYGWAPRGRQRLVLGHECVARVEQSAGDFRAGEYVVPIVRRPDPVPCPSCAVGEWDMCRNGGYTEHGIKELDGFCAERLRVHPDFLVRLPTALGALGVLIEPTSVVAKAWEQIERIGRRAHWQPRRVLVTGAGPIGLLAALLGVQRNLEVRVFDRARMGAKPVIARQLGADYSCDGLEDILSREPPDIVIECTGADEVVLDVMRFNASGAVTCLLGVSAARGRRGVDVGALNRTLVLENDVVFGSVNANRRHYQLAVEALAAADPAWLGQLITRRVPLKNWQAGFAREIDDIKVVIDVGA